MYSPSLQPLELFYEACMSLSITNNGHSVQVDFNDSDDRTGKWPLPRPGTNPSPLGSHHLGRAVLGGAACCGREVKLSTLTGCGKAWSSASAPHCINGAIKSTDIEEGSKKKIEMMFIVLSKTDVQAMLTPSLLLPSELQISFVFTLSHSLTCLWPGPQPSSL